MKQVAQKAGVSVSTVSLVMNHRDVGRVKAEIAERVRKTAEELGYRPNPLASSLRTSRTHILGFISEEVATTPYAGGIILGAQDAASRLGYIMLTVSTDGESDEGTEIAALKRYGVDGFMYAKMSNRITHVPDALKDSPVVLVDATDAEGRIPSVEPDEIMIAKDATNRLIHAGCRRIAYIGCSEVSMVPGRTPYSGCSEPMIAQDLRKEGYRQALEEAGIGYDERLVVDVLNNRPALDEVRELFDRENPDGFFCFNDARSWPVYECAARRGLSVGKDISVVGVDNHRVIAETFSPQLTTVELPHYEMGYWAACKLISMIEERSLDDVPMPATRAPIPPLDSPIPARIHCTLIEKESVAG